MNDIRQITNKELSAANTSTTPHRTPSRPTQQSNAATKARPISKTIARTATNNTHLQKRSTVPAGDHKTLPVRKPHLKQVHKPHGQKTDYELTPVCPDSKNRHHHQGTTAKRKINSNNKWHADTAHKRVKIATSNYTPRTTQTHYNTQAQTTPTHKYIKNNKLSIASTAPQKLHMYKRKLNTLSSTSTKKIRIHKKPSSFRTKNSLYSLTPTQASTKAKQTLHNSTAFPTDIPIKQDAGKLGLMWPRGNVANSHPAAAMLHHYSTEGCPVDAGANWTEKMIITALKRGPHISAKIQKLWNTYTRKQTEKYKEDS